MLLSNVALHQANEEGRLQIEPKPRFPEDYDTDAVHLHIGKVFYVLKRAKHVKSARRQRHERIQYVWNRHRGETITQFWKRQIKLGNAKKIVLKPGQVFWLYPGRTALAETMETVGLPLQENKRWAGKNTLSGKFSGRSQYAQAFAAVHVTADIFHPGSEGVKTAELVNFGDITVPFCPGDPAFQLQCMEVTGEIVAVKSFRNGQTTAIGEKPLGPNVQKLSDHPKFAAGDRHTGKRNQHRDKETHTRSGGRR